MKQANLYKILDTSGRVRGEYISASNINEAYSSVREKIASGVIKNFWKLRRCYNGGVRG